MGNGVHLGILLISTHSGVPKIGQPDDTLNRVCYSKKYFQCRHTAASLNMENHRRQDDPYTNLRPLTHIHFLAH